MTGYYGNRLIELLSEARVPSAKWLYPKSEPPTTQNSGIAVSYCCYANWECAF